MSKSKSILYNKAEALQLKNIPYSDNLDILKEKVVVDGLEIPNRMVIQPMEGCDSTPGGKPDELTKRRYRRLAAGGAGLIWFEAVALMAEGRANPRQLFMTEENADSFKELVCDIKETAMKECGVEPKIIMQATHSGRYSKPTGVPSPIIAYNNPIFEKDAPIDKSRIITDDTLKRLEELYATAAVFAKDAGFDGMDIKCCHRYLASEMLSAYTREGEFGGSFENRTRLLRSGIKNAKSAAGNGFIVTTRLNLYDGFPYPYGFGVSTDGSIDIDLTEPKKLIDILHNQMNVNIIDISIGNPYVNPNVNRPSNAKSNLEIEEPLIGVDRMYYCSKEIQSAFPNLAVVGSGVSYFKEYAANLAAGAIENGYMTLQGFGRMSFAYPDFANDIIKSDKMDIKKCCIACGKCTELMRAGSVTGCIIKDSETYLPLYKKYVTK